MRKIYLSLLLGSLFSTLSWSQDLPLLKEYTHTQKAKVTLDQGFLNIDGKKISNEKFGIQSYQLVDRTDLLLNYKLPKLRYGEEYELSVAIISADTILSVIEVLELDEKNRQIKWLGIVEENDLVEGELELQLQVAIKGNLPINCETPPVFSWKRYTSISGVGVASIVTAYFIKPSSNKNYEIYEQAVFEDETPSSINEKYNKANGQHQTYFILKYAGAGVALGGLIAGAVDYFFVHGKRDRMHKEYCNQKSLKIKPIHDTEGGIGLGLNYQF